MTTLRIRAASIAWLLGLIACQTPAPGPGETEQDRIADRYLQAICESDWDEMGRLLASDAVYEDPTMQYFDTERIDLVGREAIVDFWRTSHRDADVHALGFPVQQRFVAGPCVVLVVRCEIEMSGDIWDLPGKRLDLEGDQVILLEIVDGQIRRHVDLVDYGEALAQIEHTRRADQDRSQSSGQ